MDHLDRLDIYQETEDFFRIGQFKTYHGSAHLGQDELPDVGHCLWALVKRVTYRGEPFPTAFSDGTFMEGFTAYTRHPHLVTALTWHLLLVLKYVVTAKKMNFYFDGSPPTNCKCLINWFS